MLLNPTSRVFLSRVWAVEDLELELCAARFKMWGKFFVECNRGAGALVAGCSRGVGRSWQNHWQVREGEGGWQGF